MNPPAMPAVPRNELVGPEPLSSAPPNDIIFSRPPILRTIAGCVRYTDWTIQTAMQAGAPESVLEELGKARDIFYALAQEFQEPDSRLRKHLRDNGLIDADGFTNIAPKSVKLQ